MKIKVGIIGLGYVGLPLAKAFCEKGIKCIGFDIDALKIEKLNKAISFLPHPSNEELAGYIKNDLFHGTTDFKKVNEVNNLIICVPTPMDKYRKPDLSYVVDSINSVKQYIKKGTTISLESTTYPGTTREIIQSIFNEMGYEAGKDIYICYSPEREDPGNEDYDISNTPKIISGLTSKCVNNAEKLYSHICTKLIKVSSPEIAESAKLVENIQRSVNIGLMNELKMLADKMKLDIFEIIDAAATKPFGFSKYYPGPGVGGHCIPIDPFYLTYKAKEYGLDTKFIELAGEINRNMPNFVVEKIINILNQQKLSVSAAKILCLGLSYKKNVSDTRESPPIEILTKLIQLGADVSYSDPLFPKFPQQRKANYDLESIELTKSSLSKFDLVILLTDHDSFNYDLILSLSKAIIDTRGKFHNLKRW